MLKKIVRTLLGLTLLAGASTSLLAEMNYDQRLRASVPFAFSANDTVLPAGEYIITVHPENGTIWIQGEQQNPIILSSFRKESLDQFGRGKLVFRNDGTTKFLSEIWTRGNSTGWAIPHKEEKTELSRHAKTPLRVQIP
jgi:hypothetical protein